METQGKVVRYVSQGSLALTDAIESGMLTADARRVCERVAAENQELVEQLRKAQAANARLRDELKAEKRLNREHMRARIEAYRAVIEDDSDYRAARDLRATLYAIAFSAGALLAMILTVWAVCR